MYHVEFTPNAVDDLARLDKSYTQRIFTKSLFKNKGAKSGYPVQFGDDPKKILY